MTDLPRGWEEATLGEILLRIEAGKSFRCQARPSRHDEWGIIKVSAMTWGEFREEENKAIEPDTVPDVANEIKPGDILLSRANTEAYVGASVLVGECRPQLLLSDKSLRLIPSPSIDRRWLAHLLSSPDMRREISRRATGTKDSMRNISQNSLRDIRVLVPPLAEQHRIVSTLEDHLSRLEKAQLLTRRTHKRIEHLRTSILRSYFAELSSESNLCHRLGDVATIASGQTPKGLAEFVTPTLEPGFVPYYKVGDMNLLDDRYVRQSRTYLSHKAVKQLKLHVRPAGTVLIPKRGGAIHTNKKRIMQFPGAYDLNTMGIIPSESIHPVYLWYWMQNLDLSSLADGSNVPQINTPDLSELLIPVPILTHQESMVAELDTTIATLDQLSRVPLTERPVSLRRALLTEAFRGRGVEQDPADEPASVLLERIQAERAAQGPSERKRRTPPAARQVNVENAHQETLL